MPVKLSTVSTLYLSEPSLKEFYQRLKAQAFKVAGDNHEIIFVNDGSPDNSLQVALELSKHDPKLIIIDLSRNFGHYKAMMTGLSHAKGEKVFLIDSDLEEDPEYLEAFNNKLISLDCDVIYGVQIERKGSLFERVSGSIFWKIFNMLSHIKIPANHTTARLMTKDYVDSLVLHQEREIFISGLWEITGFEQVPYQVTKYSLSASSYTLRKKLSLALNAITSFSHFPLILIFYIGLLVSILSFIYIINLSINWVFYYSVPDGWTSLMASIWLLGGLIIFFIGVIGIYLSKIFVETKKRPYTIVKQIHKKD